MGAIAQVQGSRGHRRDANSESVTLRDPKADRFEIRNRSAIRRHSRHEHGSVAKDVRVRDRQAAAADDLDGRDRDPLHLQTDADIAYYASDEAAEERTSEREARLVWEAWLGAEEAEEVTFRQVDFNRLFGNVHSEASYARYLQAYPVRGDARHERSRASTREQLAMHLHALLLVADGLFGPDLAECARAQLPYLPPWEMVALLAALGA